MKCQDIKLHEHTLDSWWTEVICFLCFSESSCLTDLHFSTVCLLAQEKKVDSEDKNLNENQPTKGYWDQDNNKFHITTLQCVCSRALLDLSSKYCHHVDSPVSKIKTFMHNIHPANRRIITLFFQYSPHFCVATLLFKKKIS